MADTTARTLRLLSLLQRRRYWPGPELARRLAVSDRTLRRDIERLRHLGYTVESDRGFDGGYRLGGAVGATAALLLEDDEATALAVALHAAATGTAELAEASLGALAKVLPLLGPSQRQRAETLGSTTAFGSVGEQPAPPLAVLDTVASACRDHVRLSFRYVAADGAETSRYVEPCQLVALDRRWYLVAYDPDRADWRSFRVDRMDRPVPARNAFEPRPPPAADLSAWVGAGRREATVRHHVVIDIELPGQLVRDAYGAWVEVEDLADHRCRLTVDTESFLWPTHIVASLDAPFTVVAPAGLDEHLRSLAARHRPPPGR